MVLDCHMIQEGDSHNKGPEGYLALRDLVGVGLAHGGSSAHYLRCCSQGDCRDVPAALAIKNGTATYLII